MSRSDPTEASRSRKRPPASASPRTLPARGIDERTATLDRVLRARGTEERAEAEKRYLKSKLEHYGVPGSDIQRLVVEMLREEPLPSPDALRRWVESLYASDVHELRVAAVELLVAARDLLRLNDIGLLEELIRRAHTWALVDPLATRVVPALLVERAEADHTLDRWSKDQELWIRRAALIAHLPTVGKEGHEHEVERFLGYADLMLEDPEPDIRKAIGFVLRELGKKRPDVVSEWLEPRIERVSGVTLQKAIERLPDPNRKRLVTRYVRRKKHHIPRQR